MSYQRYSLYVLQEHVTTAKMNASHGYCKAYTLLYITRRIIMIHAGQSMQYTLGNHKLNMLICCGVWLSIYSFGALTSDL